MKQSIFSKSIIIILFIMVGCKKSEISTAVSAADIPVHPLSTTMDLDSLLKEIGDRRIVLLGEATHGTAEFYNWRTEITKRLILEKGFTVIGIEGEWADSYRVNQFIKGPRQDSSAAAALLKQYDRWPTWMWANREVVSLVDWLNAYNQTKPARAKAGFFGLDVYCLWESTRELMPYLENAHDSIRNAALQVEQCFKPYSSDPMDYAYAVLNTSATCQAQTGSLWRSIYNITGNKVATDEAEFVMQQNALVAFNGERYYRASADGSDNSWNIRDRHMTQTIQRLLTFHGPQSKIIVWEHNTHIGDARYTDMAQQGDVNVGQLVRETYGEENVYAVGFGTYEGLVIASDRWGGPIQNMRVPPAPKSSWEGLLHGLSPANKIVFSRDLTGVSALQKSIGHRAIGVVYNPNNERGNYVPSVIPRRYDAFVFIDKTTAVHPLNVSPRNEPPDTYPSGY